MIIFVIALYAAFIGAIVIILSALKNIIRLNLDEKDLTENTYDLRERIILINQLQRVILITATVLLTGFLVYELIKGSPMQAFVMEWLNLLVRWVHVVVGIMWIGASFYFVFLENNLNRANVREELAGNLWAIHGGGFYFLEKYKVAPKELPNTLHWFKYEAYFTWISGFLLLIIVYYMDARSFLINPAVADISVGMAITIGVGTMVLGWIIYDQLCKSALVRKPVLFALTGLVLLALTSYFLSTVFSSRAAYIHVGALIGTIMAWNVFFVIIPSQKALVKAAVLGKPLDPSLGKKAGERSLHNNYFTLPVIFIMISNHFPSTYGHQYHWIILMVLTVASAGIKHFWNLHERGQKSTFILPVSIIALIALALITSPLVEKTNDMVGDVTFAEVNSIIQTRCVQCHSVKPTDDQWNIAPNNVTFDTPQQIQAQAERIMIRSVRTETMPLGNKTNMTREERDKISAWIQQGAIIN